MVMTESDSLKENWKILMREVFLLGAERYSFEKEKDQFIKDIFTFISDNLDTFFDFVEKADRLRSVMERSMKELARLDKEEERFNGEVARLDKEEERCKVLITKQPGQFPLSTLRRAVTVTVQKLSKLFRAKPKEECLHFEEEEILLIEEVSRFDEAIVHTLEKYNRISEEKGYIAEEEIQFFKEETFSSIEEVFPAIKEVFFSIKKRIEERAPGAVEEMLSSVMSDSYFREWLSFITDQLSISEKEGFSETISFFLLIKIMNRFVREKRILTEKENHLKEKADSLKEKIRKDREAEEKKINNIIEGWQGPLESMGSKSSTLEGMIEELMETIKTLRPGIHIENIDGNPIIQQVLGNLISNIIEGDNITAHVSGDVEQLAVGKNIQQRQNE